MSKKKVTAEESGFCVYIGPTINGVVQNGSVYMGSRDEALNTLSYAIEKYPQIKSLVVTDKTLAESRAKVKEKGNALYVNYKKLQNASRKAGN